MKTSLIFAAIAALASPGISQVLTEDFSSGTPPTGWTVIDNLGAGVAGWIPGVLDPWSGDHTDWALHDYHGTLPADTMLVSPVLDLSTVSGTTLSFLTETEWTEYMAHHPSALADGVSTLEVTTDGGLTWTVLWTDDALVDYVAVTRTVDLSAYDGMNNVQFAFRYFGTDGHAWWLDDVVVDGGAALTYAVSGLVGGGTVTFEVSGATPGGNVLVGYSLAGAGPTMTPFGLVDISAPISQLPTMAVNALGVASFSTTVPPQTSGFTLFTQGADLATATLTNSLAEPIL
jgi:hypothetical protein